MFRMAKINIAGGTVDKVESVTFPHTGVSKISFRVTASGKAKVAEAEVMVDVIATDGTVNNMVYRMELKRRKDNCVAHFEAPVGLPVAQVIIRGGVVRKVV